MVTRRFALQALVGIAFLLFIVPASAQISLEATVGPPAGALGSTLPASDHVTVPPGTEVDLLLVATNTSASTTYTMQTASDELNGVRFTNSPGIVTPGGAISDEARVEVNDSQTVRCYWSMSNGVDTASAEDTVTINVQPYQASTSLVQEVEPNNTVAHAMPLGRINSRIEGYIDVGGDEDWYSFTAAAGDRVFAATMTAFSPMSAVNQPDTIMGIYGPDGTTLLEENDDAGAHTNLASGIAGLPITAGGTHFIRVRPFSPTYAILPYELYLTVETAAPTPESEPNDTPETPNLISASLGGGNSAISSSGGVSGSLSTASDVDHCAVNLNPGDTLFVSLDTDPERDGGWLANLAFSPVSPEFLAATSGSNALAQYMTVRDSGEVLIRVKSQSGFGTYQLSATVYHAPPLDYQSVFSTDTPKIIDEGPGITTSTINVPFDMPVGDLNVYLSIVHTNVPDLDATLTSPAGETVALFTNVGDGTTASIEAYLDDEAALPISEYPLMRNLALKPEPQYRLSWFDGVMSAGPWTLTIHDDAAGSGGVLNRWALRIAPPDRPAGLPPNHRLGTFLSQNFEGGNGGYTHSGTHDEWEWGTPSYPPLDDANSGTRCWATDLNNAYDSNSDQDLISAPINLGGRTPPIVVSWAQKWQMEGADADRAFVSIRPAGGGTPERRLWEWHAGTMTATVGNPPQTIQEAGGWGLHAADISDYAGQMVEMRFHLDSNGTNNYAGLAIDDVQVQSAVPAGLLDVSPASAEFGHRDVSAGPTAGHMVTIRNVASPELGITSVRLTGPDPSQFKIIMDTAETTLASGEARHVSIAYDPTLPGPHEATLEVLSDNPDTSAAVVKLRGFGNDRIAVPPLPGTEPPVVIHATGLPISIGAATPNVISSEITVAGLSDHLWDINATTFIRHTFCGDLELTLQSPAGTVVTLSSGIGGPADNLFDGTAWDDQADPNGQVPYSSDPGLLSDWADLENLVPIEAAVPEEPMGAFVGENPNGVWVLTVADQASEDGGSLDDWSLELTTSLLPPPSSTHTFSSSTPRVIESILPNVVSSEIDVSGLSNGVICQAEADTFITHTFNGDLSITLTSPAGTVVTLTSGNGSGADNVFNGTHWSDQADPGADGSHLATGALYVDGVTQTPLVPEEALAAFNGEDPNGRWVLTISDNFNEDGGALHAWNLTLHTCPPPDVISYLLGLLGNVPSALMLFDHNGDGMIDAADIVTEINTP